MKKYLIISSLILISAFLFRQVFAINSYSVHFDGNSYLQDGQIGDNLDSFTAEVWIKTSANSTGLHQIIMGKQYQYNGSGTPGWTLYTSDTGTNQIVRIQLVDTTDICYWNTSGTTVINDGIWHHVAVTWEKSNNFALKLYVDGTQEGTTDGCWNTSYSYSSPYDYTLGGQYSYSSGNRHGFNGDIDDVRLWNIVRTAQEINNDKNHELLGNETGLIGYWPLNNNVNDLTPNGHNLILNGTITYTTDIPFTDSNNPTPTPTTSATPVTATCNAEAKSLIQIKINALQSDLNSLQTLLNGL